MLNVGDKIPDFTLQDHTGATVNSGDFMGKTVVLFFYPKADTPGCTIEACGFRDAYTQFEPHQTLVYGISPNTVKEQAKFATKFELQYPLLADAEHSVAEAFGIWVEKSMYGKKYMGVDRTTFVIGPDGTLSHIFGKVKPEGHAEQVLAAVSGAS